ncbi:MAG: isochorismatase family protein [Syntrophales bacterium]|jgi:nicotinamidase/pyrazinamidase|nr:isochorismatase family protein [Syntrophales bacterium]MDY0044066.1 isochorismatase family protein [Syntrophales bacterium]
MKDTVHTHVYVRNGDALSVTDVQNDFLPGGALGVFEGDAVISPANCTIEIFRKAALPVFITRDWHPPHHSSFKEKNGPWPPHCIRYTKGAEFASRLKIPDNAIVISKGSSIERDQYSSLHGLDSSGRTQDELLKSLKIKRLFICGLATEYCVLNSVQDAREAGYEVFVLTDAIRGVNVNPGDSEKALEEMSRLGAMLITTADLKVQPA